MTSAEVAGLASRVKPQKLVLFHLSDRYAQAEWQEQLAEVRAGFPGACFPESWTFDR
jgi:ribonuclease BN (tRNA processing enzyme)